MKTIRNGILNGELQSDADGKGFYITNLAGVGTLQYRTVYVDNAVVLDKGVVGTALPFQSLSGALAAIAVDRHTNTTDRSGYLIIMRPGTYNFLGAIDLHVPNLTIFAYGAIILCDADLNEQTKLTITASNVTIKGLTIDGAYNADLSPAGFDDADVLAGAIQINAGISASLQDVTVQNFAAAGLYGQGGYNNLDVSHCQFSNNQIGILGSIGTAEVSGGNISDCIVTGSRRSAIKFLGSGDSGTLRAVVGLLIQGCTLSNNNLGDQAGSGIEIGGYSRDCRIADNYIIGSENGIRMSQANRGRISDNIIKGATDTGILGEGNQRLDITSNLIDGKAPNGTPVTITGINLNGSYVSGDDAGPYLISGNKVSFLKNTSSFGLQLSNLSDALVTGNRFTAFINILLCNAIQMIGNEFETIGSLPAILIQTSGTAAAGFAIIGNNFTVDSPTPSKLIQTDDSSSAGLADVHIIGNTSTYGKHYSGHIYVHAGLPITGVMIAANTPQTTTRTGGTYDDRDGWVNDDMVRMESDQFNINPDSAWGYMFNGIRVVRGRKTGWALPTGTPLRTTFDASTVTTAQLAQRVLALITDLYADDTHNNGHGLIGS